MKRHHNTVYVTTQGAFLGTKDETLVVRIEKVKRLQVPLQNLESIVCFGRVSCSPMLVARCAERGIGISLLTERGRFLARIQGPISGNVLLRRAQYRRADDPTKTAALARSFVAAKIASSRALLMRGARDHADGASAARLRECAELLTRHIPQLQGNADLECVRGIEGEAASAYFSVFNDLIVAQNDTFSFQGRTRRPPLDNVNALLSFVYTLVTHDAASALEAVGLDPQVGFLHRDRPGRPGLALDLVEEFRAFLADRLVLSLINRRQVQAAGFVKTETGGIVMDDATRKTVLVAYQERKQEEVTHPFLGEKTTVGMLVHLQALLLARFLRGDLDEYPAFVWR